MPAATFTLSEEELNTLRNIAKNSGCAMSAILGVAINALRDMPATEIADQVRGMTRKGPGRPASGRREARVLEGYDRLLETFSGADKGEARGNEWFSLRQIAKKSGLYPSEALGALRNLERAGILACYDGGPEMTLDGAEPNSPNVECWKRR